MEYMTRPWFIADESSDRPGFCCLAIRETDSHRLVADLADVPDEVPDFVDRAWEEASKIAFAPQLAEMLEHLLYASETRDENKYEDGELYRNAVRDAYYDSAIIIFSNLLLESSYATLALSDFPRFRTVLTTSCRRRQIVVACFLDNVVCGPLDRRFQVKTNVKTQSLRKTKTIRNLFKYIMLTNLIAL